MKWTTDLTRLWHRVTGTVGWGIWRHQHTLTSPVEAPLSEGLTGTLSMPGWHAVTTLDNRLVALCPDAAVAELLASVPDLMEPCLRPAGTKYDPATVGIPNPSDAHEAGWQSGHEVGEAEAYDEAHRSVAELLSALESIPDSNVVAAVSLARRQWSELTEDWPTHGGEADRTP